jgi:hypothetical protein
LALNLHHKSVAPIEIVMSFTCSRFSYCWSYSRNLLLQLICGLVLLGQLPVMATTFNWPNPPGWTAGAPPPGQTRTQTFTSLNPNDIMVSINNNGASATGASWQSGYPAINSTLLTGGFSGVNALQLYLGSQSSTSSYILTTVSFANPVSNLSFQLWDVDAASAYADTITNIQALAFGGGVIAATSVTSAVSGYNTISGTGLSTVVTGTATASNTTNQGTINISFDAPITEFSFRWLNTDSTLGSQGVGLGPITYTVAIPEPGAIWLSGFGGFWLCLWLRRRRLRA